ncbi:MAG: HisA/HisF-related TIM barrel protein, partial [Chloroflexota bacterium]|nr:HisA/HisF-related TIM barrel protein [Chloroflexota bacterium]
MDPDPIEIRTHGARGPTVLLLHGGPGAPGSVSDLAADLCRRYGDRIAVGIDAGKGVVWIKGWKERSGLRATEMAR